jgi:hypothetical protein
MGCLQSVHQDQDIMILLQLGRIGPTAACAMLGRRHVYIQLQTDTHILYSNWGTE